MCITYTMRTIMVKLYKSITVNELCFEATNYILRMLWYGIYSHKTKNTHRKVLNHPKPTLSWLCADQSICTYFLIPFFLFFSRDFGTVPSAQVFWIHPTPRTPQAETSSTSGYRCPWPWPCVCPWPRASPCQRPHGPTASASAAASDLRPVHGSRHGYISSWRNRNDQTKRQKTFQSVKGDEKIGCLL